MVDELFGGYDRYTAFQVVGRSDLNQNLDLIKLYAIVSAWYPKTLAANYKRLFRILQLNNQNNIKNKMRYFYLLAKRFVYGLVCEVEDGTDYFTKFRYLHFSERLKADDIYEACTQFSQYINKNVHEKFLENAASGKIIKVDV